MNTACYGRINDRHREQDNGRDDNLGTLISKPVIILQPRHFRQFCSNSSNNKGTLCLVKYTAVDGWWPRWSRWCVRERIWWRFRLLVIWIYHYSFYYHNIDRLSPITCTDIHTDLPRYRTQLPRLFDAPSYSWTARAVYIAKQTHLHR